jgi:hypothetical protein
VSGYIFPFHYDHPVTGKPTSETKKNAKLLKNAKAAEKIVLETLGKKAAKPAAKAKSGKK